MRKLLLSLFFALSTIATFASHQAVFELNYEHIPNTNKYIFTVTFASEGLFLGAYTPRPIESNSPADSITLNFLYANVYTAPPCSMPNYVILFRSDTVDLGPIPTNGYTFSYSDCCRNGSTGNITNSSGRGYYIDAVMYPEPGQTYASSSPRFVNPAAVQQLTPGIFTLNQPAMDPDGDSIFYMLTDVRDGTFKNHINIPYSTGYSGSMPLGITIPITINQAAGSFSAVNVPVGGYVFNVKVESFKNGQRTSTINRDLRIYALLTAPIAPSISLLNYSGSTPLNVSPGGVYQITVKTEDSIAFDVNGAVLLDSIALAGTSRLFALTSNTAGNCVGNCADFTANPNLFGAANATGRFTFVADTTHLLGSDTTNYDVVFLAASQGTCKPIMTANLFVRISVVRNSGIGLAENIQLKCSVFPNPSSGLVQIVNPFGEAKKVRLISSFGQEVATFYVHSGANEINLGSYTKGLYFLVDEGGNCTKLLLQ